MNRNRLLLAAVSAAFFAGLSVSGVAQAEDAATEPETPRAVWVNPATEPAPWLDMRPNTPQIVQPQVIATGRSIALMRLPDGSLAAVDEKLAVLGAVWVPENVKWIGVDGNDRILVYDGAKLRVSPSFRDAAQESGYFDGMALEGVAKIDNGFELLSYVDGHDLVVTGLDTGTAHRVRLSDFFVDEMVAQRTPEAVAAAETLKSSKNKKAIKAAEKAAEAARVAAEQSAGQPFDVAGLWMRDDDTIVVRVRRMLNERTFVSADGGHSWRQIAEAPASLVHQGAWIWDGQDRILARDGAGFVTVTGNAVYPVDRMVMLHVPEISAAAAGWRHTENPVSSENGEPVEIGIIPQWQPSQTHQIAQREAGLYQPEMGETGVKMGFYRDAACAVQSDTCEAGMYTQPGAWQIVPGESPKKLDIPESCEPVYLGSARGLGLLLCGNPGAANGAGNPIDIYVKASDGDWVRETSMPAEIAQDIRIAAAEDGTIAILGACYDEAVAAAAPDPEKPDQSETAAEESAAPATIRVCPVAVRQPEAVSRPEIWRLERVVNAYSMAVMTGGRMLAIQADSPAASFQRMTLLEPGHTDTLVESFDPGLYRGVVFTSEGCLALDDGSMDAQTLRNGGANVRLLSTKGGFAGMDCLTSKSVKEAQDAAAAIPDEPEGEARFGLRLGGAGFIATGNVRTWSMRVEGLIPLYGGMYEVGLLYRMGGGNKPNALGHLGILSVRWRYDKLDLFDFAVGAGIGFGSMCGYKKPQESEEDEDEEEDTNERKKGYEACHTLSMRYMISAIAAYKFAKQWKLYIAAELLGGSEWGLDIGGGIEVRF